MRSSKSPRYLVPATILVKSSVKSVLFSKISGTFLVAILCAKPSIIAVLPTPGSPIKQGLFLLRRQRIWIIRSISLSLPITGSILPVLAFSVRFTPYFWSVGVLVFFLASDSGLFTPISIPEAFRTLLVRF